ncbi:MAG TPA: hypothetical protein VE619_04935 [Nitrososphaeraceae archaeon]|nr:hypothetical protein [Nitrososphaeraceae archaeon]
MSNSRSYSEEKTKVLYDQNEIVRRVVAHLIQDYQNQLASDNKIKLVYDDDHDEEQCAKDNARILIKADKHRINQSYPI